MQKVFIKKTITFLYFNLDFLILKETILLSANLPGAATAKTRNELSGMSGVSVRNISLLGEPI